MKCPYCKEEMRKGGMVAFGTTQVRWLPTDEYTADSYEHATSEGFDIGEVAFEMRGLGTRENVKLGKAHFCPSCYKAVGIFDISP